MKNILINAIKGQNFIVMLKKFFKRLERSDSAIALRWAKTNTTITTDQLLKNIDESLFNSIKHDITNIETKANNKLKDVGLDLGGGGNYFLLYFLVRKFKPNIVLETGVAMGWTSLFILEALKINNSGKLYSSDFPYFRLKNPEKYVGCLVEEADLRARWELYIQGDEFALPHITSLLGEDKINLFHYDSDKSYSGRQFALKTIRNNLSPECIIIFDDIQDNLHFKDLVEDTSFSYKVVEFQDKYVGIIGV